MPLKLLIADRKLGAASKLAFLQLWEYAGGKPGPIVITADWLGGSCGRSPKAAWLWLEELQKHDLIRIGKRNERRGSVSVDLYNPCPGGDREATPDRQLRLGAAAAGVTGEASGTREGSEVSATEPPSPLVPKNSKENLSYQSTNVSRNSKDPMDSMSAATIAVDVAAAVAAIAGDVLGDPADQKARLKRRIQAACGSSNPVAEWVAGSAANLVVYHEVPIGELQLILGDVDAMRQVGKLQNAGRFFHFKVRELAARLGKPWPRHKPR